ncbi:BPSL0761 family protein [Salinisphaera sp. SWV1]|uniref:BPSL0761 family protein n=1 Tax=Salinisphaera sp. SWV1 TaxID=3454139 RepID=UPI003F83F2FB
MTMPNERTRAVIATREFLEQMSRDRNMPQELRCKAKALLRHYPNADDIRLVGRKERELGLKGLAHQVFSESEHI